MQPPESDCSLEPVHLTSKPKQLLFKCRFELAEFRQFFSVKLLFSFGFDGSDEFEASLDDIPIRTATQLFGYLAKRSKHDV